MTTFEETQSHEADSWLLEDATIRAEKAQRETVRYPLLKKQMGLTHLDTSHMTVWDIGAGPLGGVSTVLNARHIVRIDPLGNEYAKFYPQIHMLAIKAEDLGSRLSQPDLIIITNALDHFENPTQFLKDLVRYMKPGAFFSHLHAENNSYTHKHEAHAHSLNEEVFNEYLSSDFECVWKLNYKEDGLRYGWHDYNGQVGQPAFSGLYRKVTGYGG